jgi:hypothetical protein
MWDHTIKLVPDAKPANWKVYPISPLQQKELDAFIAEGLSTGHICPLKSPMVLPGFFIKKKDSALQFVQDYRVLKVMTVKNQYPLPLINNLINRLKGARFFTKLDVWWGFNNVRIRKGDEWKATFRTNRGLFEPLVMYFGLTNSPATFQTMLNAAAFRSDKKGRGLDLDCCPGHHVPSSQGHGDCGARPGPPGQISAVLVRSG